MSFEPGSEKVFDRGGRIPKVNFQTWVADRDWPPVVGMRVILLMDRGDGGRRKPALGRGIKDLELPDPHPKSGDGNHMADATDELYQK